MLTVIKRATFRGRTFTIVHDGKFYMAIEDRYVTDGKTNTALNGLQTYASESVSQCLTTMKNAVESDYLVSQGYSRAEAFCIIFNCMDKLADIERIMGA